MVTKEKLIESWKKSGLPSSKFIGLLIDLEVKVRVDLDKFVVELEGLERALKLDDAALQAALEGLKALPRESEAGKKTSFLLFVLERGARKRGVSQSPLAHAFREASCDSQLTLARYIA